MAFMIHFLNLAGEPLLNGEDLYDIRGAPLPGCAFSNTAASAA